MKNKQEKLILKGTFKDPEDGCIKGVYESKRGISEFTFIPNKEDIGVDVYCVPTHHYCNLGCKICHLTTQRLNKRMLMIKEDEFIEGLNSMTYKNKSQLTEENRRTPNKKLLISYMGVGEPLFNKKLIERVFEKEKFITKSTRYTNINYALSTIMPDDSLISLGEYVKINNMPLKVHFSLHSPFSNERFDLLPKTNVSVIKAFDLLKEYETAAKDIKPLIKPFHKKDDNIEIHYTLIKELNDSNKHLEELISIDKDYKIPIKFLRFNPTGNMEKSNRENYWINRLQEALPEVNILAYTPPGKNIGSSCGEFTKHYYLSKIESEEDKKEFNEWKNKFEIFE